MDDQGKSALHHGAESKVQNLALLAQSAYECLRCAFCFDLSWLGSANLCPSYTWGSFESYGARGRIAIARALLEGDLEPDETLIERVFACTECRACAQACFKYIDTVKVYAAMRADLAERGLLPPQLSFAAEQLAQTHNLYGKPAGERISWLSDRSWVDRPARYAFFVGCTPALVRRSLARDTYVVLEASGLEFTILGDEWCCGHPFLAAGQRQRAAETLDHNVRELARLGVEQVIFQCPGCMRTFREDGPDLLGQPLPFQVVHLTEWMAQQVEAGRLRLGVYQPGMVVTYHDPCTLGRGLGIYDAPRTIIGAVPGMRLYETHRHGPDAYCCGAGSFVRYDYPGLCDQTGAERWDEIVATGAQMVLTACPACLTQLQHIRQQHESLSTGERGQAPGAASAQGSRIEVMDLVSLVRRLAHWR